jgi:hypothetical protein
VRTNLDIYECITFCDLSPSTHIYWHITVDSKDTLIERQVPCALWIGRKKSLGLFCIRKFTRSLWSLLNHMVLAFFFNGIGFSRNN